jgi:hypothetical protein
LPAALICIFALGVKKNVDRGDPARQARMGAENLGKKAEDRWNHFFLFHEGLVFISVLSRRQPQPSTCKEVCTTAKSLEM